MRGTHGLNVQGSTFDGIIPAYAGNTFAHPFVAALRGDHPRVCGEHFRQLSAAQKRAGSSPRMRGTPLAKILLFALHGIIPAYAGNTCLPLAVPTPKRDHPRVCGEHFGTARGGGTHRGSSPRMRGTRAVCCDGDDRIGIIPAYAGNTHSPSDSSHWIRDHPRVCGEHTEGTSKTANWQGSSPRMRGTRTPASRESVQNGIIPAYAGNTHVEERTYSSCRDHPRVCGEHASVPALSHLVLGSSPRMRGTPSGMGDVDVRRGIIPAYAGNTTGAVPSPPTWWDHPRVCGEHSSASSLVVTR